MIGQLQVGGTEKHLAAVLPALARRGKNVSVCALLDDGPLRSTLEAGGVRVFGPLVGSSRNRNVADKAIRGALIVLRLFVLLRRRKPTIVHFFLPFSYLVGAPVAMVAGISYKVMSRRSLNNYQRGHSISAFIERRLHSKMDAVLANSISVLRQLRKLEFVPAGRLALIYNGIDFSSCCPNVKEREKVRSELGLENDALVLIVVANLIPYKGHADLIDALHLSAARLPSGWRLLVAGRDDVHGVELRSRVVERGLQSNVIFLGARSDIAGLLQASDIGINCSHEEGFSNAVLEGMAAGLAMIVTDVGGNTEAVIDGESGLVAPAKEPVELARLILRLAEDPELRSRLGHAARKRIVEHFTLSRCVANYEMLYSELLKSGTIAENIRFTG